MLAACCLPFICHAQFQISGSVQVDTGQPLSFANILLLNSVDSNLVRGEVSGEDGSFTFNVHEAGQYFITVSSIGYQSKSTEEFELNRNTSPLKVDPIIPQENASTLAEVVVKADKQLFEQKIDRTIVNVGSYLSRAGGSALDVLQRSPGVSIDRMNNAIALSGKQGVRIMINGRISRLPMAAVVQMLEGMNAENIDRVELITTPPSRYEAEGDAGMINIVLKKTEDIGTNGSLSVFSGYGRRAKYGGTLNLNTRSKSLNVFGDISTRQNYSQQFFDTKWSVPINNQLIETESKNNRKSYTGISTGSLGFDWKAGNKTTIGGLFNVFDRKWDMDGLADIVQTADQDLANTVLMNTIEKNNWLQLLGNINLRHVFNSSNALTINVDKISYNSENPTDYFQDFFDAQSLPTMQGKLRSRKDTGIEIWTSSLDFTGKINSQISYEVGVKGSFTDLQNDIVVDDLNDGSWIIDNELTSFANMYENIGAFYASTTIKATDKLDIQAGIRYEHTRTNIDTRQQDNVVDRDYGEWFPSFFINHRINDINSWVFSYSRRISRPSFFQLAPFVIFNDPNNFFSGNIALLPSFTDALKLEYKLKSVLLSLQYSHDKNSISLFQPRINNENKQVSTAENLDYRNNYSVVLSFPIRIAKWWEMQFNGIGSHYSVKATYLEDPISISINNFSFNGSQKFKISKTLNAELSGFYQSRQLFGIMEMRGLGGLDFGFEKKFANSSLRASYSDIFGTNKWKFTAVIPSEKLNSFSSLDFETTVFNITYTKTFGNTKLKSKKRTKTGSEEEQRRFQ